MALVSPDLVGRWESLPGHERALRAVFWRVVHGRAASPIVNADRELVVSSWEGPEDCEGYVLEIPESKTPNALRVVLAPSLIPGVLRVDQVLLLAGERSREIYRHANAVSARAPRVRELRRFVLASVLEHFLRVEGLLARGR